MSDIITTVRPVTLSLSEVRENLNSYATSWNDNSVPWRGSDSTSWNNNPNEGRTFYSHLALYVNGGLSSHIVDTALVENDQRDALAENLVRYPSHWEDALLAPVEGAPFTSDDEAALVQAELLGASADQRAKLRAMVTARILADRQAIELRAQLADVRNQLAVANEDILDGHDPRTMQLFANTGAVADKQGLCSVYDQIARDSLIPTRPELADAGYVGDRGERDYYVTVSVTVQVQTSVSVTASDENEAAEQVGQMSHRDIWEYLDLGNSSHYDIETFETGDVEEA